MKKILHSYLSEITGIVFCVSFGLWSGYISHAENGGWYQTLTKPWFTPPNWIFSPVWIVLYILMGIALGKLWNQRQKNSMALILFIIQFCLNVIWSPLFFKLHSVEIALLDIVALWITLAALLAYTQHLKKIQFLLIPYFVWVSFAMILNERIYHLNQEPLYEMSTANNTL